MWLKDPKTGEKSVTLTTFICGFAVCVIKLLLSGVVIKNTQLGAFTGGDFAASVAALGTIYWARRNVSTTGKDE